jgi:hypothetical protein
MTGIADTSLRRIAWATDGIDAITVGTVAIKGHERLRLPTLATNTVSIRIPASAKHSHPPMEQSVIRLIWANHERRIGSLGPISVMHDSINGERSP